MTRTGNRAFLLTPPGGAAIAVVRLSGPLVGLFLSSHFGRVPRPGRAVHGELIDAGRGGQVLDDPVVVLSADGAFADVSLHGGPWVVCSALELARRAGFHVAPPAGAGVALPLDAVDAESDARDAEGELTREMLGHLPLALTELGVRALLAQPAAWAGLRREAAEGGGTEPKRWAGLLEDRSLWWLLHPPRVAIVGAANVGKSTLANQLFARERSITADLPGTTRDWVGEVADVNGLPVMLVDTPGLRQTDDPIESSAIGRAREQIETADLVVLVLDATRPGDAGQSRLRTEYPDAICVINKCDKCDQIDSVEVPPDGVGTVATRGVGVEELRRAIVSRFGCEGIHVDQPRWWTARQRDWLREQEGSG